LHFDQKEETGYTICVEINHIFMYPKAHTLIWLFSKWNFLTIFNFSSIKQPANSC